MTRYQWRKLDEAEVSVPAVLLRETIVGSANQAESGAHETPRAKAHQEGYDEGHALGLEQGLQEGRALADQQIKDSTAELAGALQASLEQLAELQTSLRTDLAEHIVTGIETVFETVFAHELSISAELLTKVLVASGFDTDHPLQVSLAPDVFNRLMQEQSASSQAIELVSATELADSDIKVRSPDQLGLLNLPRNLNQLLESLTLEAAAQDLLASKDSDADHVEPSLDTPGDTPGDTTSDVHSNEHSLDVEDQSGPLDAN